eukprot:TRINITY_DN7726_c0_g1_i1.p1 TRINITY_DN7726_c0_g1~~TRINITY_DN7726_c0_g1_i1.p1  ORF type:complete len:407 (-),score=61.49 TRINITY_DN7726_c0_g1_i1:7-1227(-)
MKFFVLLTLLVLGFTSASELLAQKLVRPTNAYSIYEDSFIVMMDNASVDDLYDHIGRIEPNNTKVHFTYEGFSGFKGYAFKTRDMSVLEDIAADPRVTVIEHDQEMRTQQSGACAVQNRATWGLNRISEVELNLDGKYFHDVDGGNDVVSYIIDTGIYTKNSDFQGRAVWGANYADSVNDDCNGHGTHVAGTVGGKEYGVAKKTQLVAVKVLACNGSGSNSGVIKGVEYAAKGSAKRKVANMSLGGGKSTALNRAVDDAVTQGVLFAVAAGNDNANACNYSPASAALSVSVGATDVASRFGIQEDIRSSFSNWGTCVDINAPGSDITSDWIGGVNAIRTISGTSMASPHVAGALAELWSIYPTYSRTQIQSTLMGGVTSGRIDFSGSCSRSGCTQTPNTLLYSHCN